MSGYETFAFAAMGTEIEVLAAPTLPSGVTDRVRDLFGEMERRFSRFLDESELSSLNRSAGVPFPASPVLAEVLRAALRAKEMGGLFDPTVLPELEAAGYTRTFDSIGCGVRTTAAVMAPARRDAIAIGADGVITMPQGCRVDLGGFVKGWTVDRAGALMPAEGNWCINAGGDLLAQGPGPEGDGWIAGVEDPPRRDALVAAIRVRDAAVATSSVMRRRWRTDGGVAHHIIDPRTGQPAATDLASVTVLARTVADAEVLAKQMLLQGRREGYAQAVSRGACVLFVGRAGDVTITPSMEAHVVW